MTDLKLFTIALALPLTISIAYAQAPSDQDIRLMAAAQKAVESYRSAGVAGLGQTVEDCESSLSRASGEEEVEYCVALNLAAMHVDAIATKAANIPRDNRFKDEMVVAQSEEVLKFYRVVTRSDDLMPYINDRNAKVHSYVLTAINGPKGATDQAEASNSDEFAAAAKAFTEFWTSTDCAELQELSEWPQLVKQLRTNDEQLCNTFVQMHQRVLKVDIIGVQPLPGNRVRVKANLALTPQGSMNQEDTFALVDGKWVLSAR
jgi:hypothetical protein